MGRQLRILVVDDDTDNASAIAELFEIDDHNVVIAHDGNEAIVEYDRQSFDVGFFDVMMPNKNGVDSFLEIRERHPNARVYFMTGFSENTLLDKARTGGALGVFDKPTDPSMLLDVVEREAA